MSWKRKITEDHPAKQTIVSVSDLVDLQDWLVGNATGSSTWWLLAHADDGVIWGRVDQSNQGVLVTSHSAAKGHQQAKKVCPALRVCM